MRRGQGYWHSSAIRDARNRICIQVTTSSKLLAGEGVPYLIDQYSSKSTSNVPAELHRHELPLDKSVVTFGEVRRK